jgi:GH25 family lysozyme M1 (1,4-beta-N-acetylmuramidase)
MSKSIKVLIVITLIAAVVVIAVAFVSASMAENKPGGGNGQSAQSEPSQNVTQTTETVVSTTKDFLNDKDFLDAEQPFQGVERDESRTKLSLLATSVSRDLRVIVTDSRGKAVPGEKFSITIAGVGTYSDNDEDGIIYVAGLRSGQVKVTLNEIEGYECDDTLDVTISEKIEYTALSDVSYLIKTEADIDAMAEDTGIRDTEVDESAYSKLLTDYRDEGKIAVPGIDVSKWNKTIDWNKVAKSGVKFVIIRCGYRGSKTGALVEDPYFVQNIEGAKAAGLEVGLYFFTQAVDEKEAVEEASACLTLLGDRELDLPIFIDTEGSGGRADSIDNATRTAVCQAFCKTIQDAGFDSGIYASRNWFYTKLNDASLMTYNRWLAEYTKTPQYTGRFVMWQYTSKGSIDGIEGNVDLNLYFQKEE